MRRDKIINKILLPSLLSLSFMDLSNGYDLDNSFKEETTITTSTAFDLAFELCEGLAIVAAVEKQGFLAAFGFIL